MSRTTIPTAIVGTNTIGGVATQKLDLRGVRCPLNWAKAKVRLEGMARGEILSLHLDDPKSLADIPRAAEAEGYAVVATQGSLTEGWILIEK